MRDRLGSRFPQHRTTGYRALADVLRNSRRLGGASSLNQTPDKMSGGHHVGAGTSGFSLHMSAICDRLKSETNLNVRVAMLQALKESIAVELYGYDDDEFFSVEKAAARAAEVMQSYSRLPLNDDQAWMMVMEEETSAAIGIVVVVAMIRRLSFLLRACLLVFISLLLPLTLTSNKDLLLLLLLMTLRTSANKL